MIDSKLKILRGGEKPPNMFLINVYGNFDGKMVLLDWFQIWLFDIRVSCLFFHIFDRNF